ncbi:hypothetical protein HN018_06745 [Lichenicola cladoniae]|uniref:Uncharacterized protein n=1 Tax=Lichenicola cladoniae TaxID=1484109 RepID=A0A6M8HNA4_9PROT|nr:hypothetical protein [Lichenicola cladoniae]NPD67270.1 hypothetical protein [Acetobacteraceae bacterium]QKE89775.1 hypothetical protein HN018_06745 [Lichenicola cladoniae]
MLVKSSDRPQGRIEMTVRGIPASGACEQERYAHWLDLEEELEKHHAPEALTSALFDLVMGKSARTLDRVGVIGTINTAVKSLGSQAAFAKAAHVSQPHLSLMLSGQRDFNDQVLIAAGIRRYRVDIERFDLIEQQAHHG